MAQQILHDIVEAEDPGWFKKKGTAIKQSFKRQNMEFTPEELRLLNEGNNFGNYVDQGFRLKSFSDGMDKMEDIYADYPLKTELIKSKREPVDEAAKHYLMENKFYRDMMAIDKKPPPPQYCGQKNVVLGLILLMGLYFIIWEMIWKKYLHPDKRDITMDTSEDADEKTINTRIADRGMVTSLVSSAIIFSISFIIDGVGAVNGSTSSALLGQVLGGTIGFMADIGFGTDEGLRWFKKSNVDGMNFTFGSLATAKYLRFILVTLIDTFISLMIFSVAYPKAKRLWLFECQPAAANGFMSAVIAMITFKAYANMSRFLWAYPDPKIKPLPTALIFMILAVIAATFMNVNTMFDLDQPNSTSISVQGINHPTVKFFMVILVFMLMTYVKHYNLDVTTDQAQEEILELGYTGKLIFIVIFALTIFLTMLTSTRDPKVKYIFLGILMTCVVISAIYLMGSHEDSVIKNKDYLKKKEEMAKLAEKEAAMQRAQEASEGPNLLMYSVFGIGTILSFILAATTVTWTPKKVAITAVIILLALGGAKLSMGD